MSFKLMLGLLVLATIVIGMFTYVEAIAENQINGPDGQDGQGDEVINLTEVYCSSKLRRKRPIDFKKVDNSFTRFNDFFLSCANGFPELKDVDSEDVDRVETICDKLQQDVMEAHSKFVSEYGRRHDKEEDQVDDKKLVELEDHFLKACLYTPSALSINHMRDRLREMYIDGKKLQKNSVEIPNNDEAGH